MQGAPNPQQQNQKIPPLSCRPKKSQISPRRHFLHMEIPTMPLTTYTFAPHFYIVTFTLHFPYAVSTLVCETLLNTAKPNTKTTKLITALIAI